MIIDGVKILFKEDGQLEFIIPSNMGTRQLKAWKKRYFLGLDENKY